MAATAAVLSLSDARRARQQGLSVSLSNQLKGDPLCSVHVTVRSNEAEVERAREYLSKPENAARGSRRRDEFEQEMAGLDSSVAFRTRVGSLEVFYSYCAAAGTVEILSIYDLSITPPSRPVPLSQPANRNFPRPHRPAMPRRPNPFIRLAASGTLAVFCVVSLLAAITLAALMPIGRQAATAVSPDRFVKKVRRAALLRLLRCSTQ